MQRLLDFQLPQSGEDVGDVWRSVHRPFSGSSGTFHSPAPLHQTAFFPDMNLLTGADQSDNNTPFRNAFRELDEMLRLRPPITSTGMFLGNLVGVKRSLCLIEDQHMLR